MVVYIANVVVSDCTPSGCENGWSGIRGVETLRKGEHKQEEGEPTTRKDLVNKRKKSGGR